MIVDNFTSLEGNKVANQFEIKLNPYRIFQSYKTIIAVKNMDTDQVILDRGSWDCSRTTSKYRTQFLGEITNRTRAKINKGTYILKDLNKNSYYNVAKFTDDLKEYFLEHGTDNRKLAIPSQTSIVNKIKDNILTKYKK
jgi:hypothetical protein